MNSIASIIQEIFHDEGPVFEFLAALKPDLSRLTPRFVHAGVRCHDDLAGLAALLYERRMLFLRVDLRLEQFHCVIINAGLENMFSRN